MKIKFIEVGRMKRTWESECPANNVDELDYDWMYLQVKKNGLVMSYDIDFYVNEDGKSGAITAGFYTIGKFEIIG